MENKELDKIAKDFRLNDHFKELIQESYDKGDSIDVIIKMIKEIDSFGLLNKVSMHYDT